MKFNLFKSTIRIISGWDMVSVYWYAHIGSSVTTCLLFVTLLGPFTMSHGLVLIFFAISMVSASRGLSSAMDCCGAMTSDLEEVRATHNRLQEIHSNIEKNFHKVMNEIQEMYPDPPKLTKEDILSANGFSRHLSCIPKALCYYHLLYGTIEAQPIYTTWDDFLSEAGEDLNIVELINLGQSLNAKLVKGKWVPIKTYDVSEILDEINEEADKFNFVYIEVDIDIPESKHLYSSDCVTKFLSGEYHFTELCHMLEIEGLIVTDEGLVTSLENEPK